MFLCVFWIRDGKEERDGKKEKNESRFEVLIKEEEGKKKLAVERRVRWRAKQEKKKKGKEKKIKDFVVRNLSRRLAPCSIQSRHRSALKV